LLKERVGESMYVDGLEITKEDFNIDVEIIPNGSIDLANSQVRIGKSLTRMQLIMNLPPTIVTPDDHYNAVFDYLENDGVRDPDRYITKPEIIAQAQQDAMLEEDAILARQDQDMAREEASLRRRAAAQQMANGGNGNGNGKVNRERPTGARTGAGASQGTKPTNRLG